MTGPVIRTPEQGLWVYVGSDLEELRDEREVGLYNERVTALRGDLDHEEFDRAWDEGRALDLSAAIRFALAEPS